MTLQTRPVVAGPLSVLTEWALSMHAFRRNKVPATHKVVAAALCHSGYSYRDVARMIGGMSYVSVRDAYFALTTSLPEGRRRNRRMVEVDGADVWVGERHFHVWLARDVESGEIMSFQASPEASAEDGAKFLSTVASQCSNRPLLRMGAGANAPRGLMNLDLYFQLEPSQSIITRLGRLLLGNGIWEGV